jgi:hypothetical protein
MGVGGPARWFWRICSRWNGGFCVRVEEGGPVGLISMVSEEKKREDRV